MGHIAIVLIAVLSDLSTIEAAPPPDLHKLLLGMERETKINVKMANGDKIDGRVGSVGTDRFSLTVGNSPNSRVRGVAFADVDSIKRAGMRKLVKIPLLVVVGILLAFGLALATNRAGSAPGLI